MRRLWICLALAMLGCGPAPRRDPPPRRAADKAALYADAALLPTRAGERARVEVALAEEIRLALETLHAVEQARVSVRSAGDGRPRAAAIVLRISAPDTDGALEATARRLALATLGPDAELVIEGSVQAPESDEQRQAPHPTPLLLFAVLGLGISLGLTFDRARRALRRHRARS